MENTGLAANIKEYIKLVLRSANYRTLVRFTTLVRGLAIMGLFCLLTAPIAAQTSKDGEKRSWGYAYYSHGWAVGNGNSSSFHHLGGGGDVLFAKHLGLTADLGYLWSGNRFDSGIGALSVGPILSTALTSKNTLFVNGGYTLFFRSGSANGFWFGGGLQHWLNDHVGVRVEGRDQVLLEHDAHFVEIRFGVSFR